MGSGTTRLALAVLALLAIWIGVYWSVDPAPLPPPRVTFGEAPPRLNHPPRPGPVAPTGEAAPARPTITQVVPPRFREYTVQPGDTLSRIAERVYGSPRWADAIKRAMPLSRDPNRLRPGSTIRLPEDPTNIQGRLEVVEPPEPAPPPTPSPSAASPK
ncbi:MAG: LysM peptidoglycan-binding domain-containing protein, partial [Phycisphaerales bacterium]|nr:LysM peptidoglycan-binding domain-containing protein [Phycisphaerales bacterium]